MVRGADRVNDEPCVCQGNSQSSSREPANRSGNQDRWFHLAPNLHMTPGSQQVGTNDAARSESKTVRRCKTQSVDQKGGMWMKLSALYHYDNKIVASLMPARELSGVRGE